MFDAERRDRELWATVERISLEGNYDLEQMFRHFPAYALRRDITRFLSHYELFKLVEGLPGCIVEVGVWRGSSFFTWSKLLDSFCPYDRSRKVFGFDSFEGLQDFRPQDGARDADPRVQKTEGGYLASENEVSAMLTANNSDSMIPGTNRSVLYKGDVAETLPRFLDENPGVRISLLHFDLDLYQPTKTSLEALFPLVVKGGVVAFDEYGLVPWRGETEAVDEYFREIGLDPMIMKHPWAQTPHGYLVK